MKLITDEQINQAFDDAFDRPVFLDHKPTPEEIIIIRLRAVVQAQRDDTSEYYEAIIKELEETIAYLKKQT